MNNKKLHSSINMHHDVTAEAHYIYSRDIRDNAKSFRDFIYAALELRMCIERLCFEYLVLCTYKIEDISKGELKLYKPEQLFAKALERKPYFEKMVDFINALYEQENINRKMIFPDIKWLQKIYGKIGIYLHKQSKELTDAKKTQLISIINNSLPTIESYIRGRGSIRKFSKITQQIFDDYLSDKIDKKQMKLRFRISSIPQYFLHPNNR